MFNLFENYEKVRINLEPFQYTDCTEKHVDPTTEIDLAQNLLEIAGY